MNARNDPPTSRALFALPSGLELATGQSSRESVARAKQASVLFDEIVVESGVRVVEISARGLASVLYHQPEVLSPGLLSDLRELSEGTTTGMAVVTNDEKVEIHLGTNLPRMEGAFYTEQEVSARYVSEYHSGVLEDLASLGGDWIRVVSIRRPADAEREVLDRPLECLPQTGDPNNLHRILELDADEARELAEAIRRVTASDRPSDQDPEPARRSESSRTERMLVEDLAEAISLGDQLGAIPALSSAFTDVAVERGVPIGLPGSESLGFIVPNFSALPWEAIAEFRDHQGAVDARGQLRQFEAEAAARERDRSPEFVRATAQAVTNGLVGAVKDLAPSLPDEMVSPTLSAGVGLIPIVGQYASLAISMGDMIAAVQRHEKFEGSWVAAVIDLRSAAADATISW